jgi:virginiamycin B lyase
MQLGSRPLFPFLIAVVVAGCGGNGGGGSAGGAGGSSATQTGGAGGTGARGGATGGGGSSAGGGAGTGAPSAGSGGATSGSGGAAGGSGGSGAATGGAGGATGGAGGATGGASGTDGPPAAGMLKIDKFFDIPGASAGAPHDPAVDGKGIGWFTDQGGSRIGFWDPATGMNRVWQTPTMPCTTHGLTEDADDNIWYTGQGCDKIGKLDRATGNIREYPAGGAGPHTPVVLDGIVWYTLQSGNKLGRLDPRAAAGMEVQTFDIGPGPYGIWVSPRDKKLWVALFGTNQIVEVDPANPGAPKRVNLPNGASRPRRIAVDRNGVVYYTDYPRGYLGRYDPTNTEAPENQRFKEWLSPKGAGPGPYGITVGPEGDDRIYYYQGMNSIAVFNPRTEKFDQVVDVGAPVDAVRNIETDPVRRRIWLGLAGAKRLAYIQLP